MSKVSGTYTGGALYRYSTTLSVGSHTYHFEASDGTNTARLPTSGENSGPTVTEVATTLTISPSVFQLATGGSTTLTATLTSGGSPLAGEMITWITTAGSVTPSSGTTDSQSRVTVTYTAPSYETVATVTASFASTGGYQGSSDTSYITVRFELVLTFRKTDGSPFANVSIHYSRSREQINYYLGTTDSEGKITITSSDLSYLEENLAGLVYFKIEREGQTYVGEANLSPLGGESTIQLSSVSGVSEFPTSYMAAIVLIGCVAGAIAFKKWGVHALRRPSGPKPKKLAPPKLAPAQFCPRCGAELTKDDIFCSKCGAKARRGPKVSK
jgi:ribosomal protein L40E